MAPCTGQSEATLLAAEAARNLAQLPNDKVVEALITLEDDQERTMVLMNFKPNKRRLLLRTLVDAALNLQQLQHRERASSGPFAATMCPEVMEALPPSRAAAPAAAMHGGVALQQPAQSWESSQEQEQTMQADLSINAASSSSSKKRQRVRTEDAEKEVKQKALDAGRAGKKDMIKRAIAGEEKPSENNPQSCVNGVQWCHKGWQIRSNASGEDQVEQARPKKNCSKEVHRARKQAEAKARQLLEEQFFEGEKVEDAEGEPTMKPSASPKSQAVLCVSTAESSASRQAARAERQQQQEATHADPFPQSASPESQTMLSTAAALASRQAARRERQQQEATQADSSTPQLRFRIRNKSRPAWYAAQIRKELSGSDEARTRTPSTGAAQVPRSARQAACTNSAKRKQSGEEFIVWDAQSFSWKLRYRNKHGQRETHGLFSIRPFMQQGFGEKTAEGKALDAAKAAKKSLIKLGIIKVGKRHPPNKEHPPSSIKGVHWHKSKKAWEIAIRISSSGQSEVKRVLVRPKDSTEVEILRARKKAETKALQIRKEHGLEHGSLPKKTYRQLKKRTSTVAGIYWQLTTQSWRAHIRIDGKTLCFWSRPKDDSEEAAGSALEAAAAWRREKLQLRESLAASGRQKAVKKRPARATSNSKCQR